MVRRRSSLFLIYVGVNLFFLGLIFIHSFVRTSADRPLLEAKREMVRTLGLTDLCLFTDARYTRHPSMADLNTPFQDYPMSFEHFPSATLLTAPPHLKGKVSVSVPGVREKSKTSDTDTIH